RRRAGLVLVGRPEPRRVRGERLVAEDEAARPVEAELELRVGEDDPPAAGVLGDEPVERERNLFDLVEAGLADQLDRSRAIDVLVVPRRRLRRGREDRLRQLLRLDEPGGQSVTAHLAGRDVVLPAGARAVAAHDALDGKHLETLALGRTRVVADGEQ